MSILIAIVSGFASGIFFRSLFNFSWEPVVFVLILAALFGGAILFAESRRVYSLAAMFCLFVAFGMVRAMIADTPVPDAFAKDLKHRVSYDAVVVADPDVREKNQRIGIEVGNVGMLAVMPLSSDVRVGDRVRVYGTLSLPQAFETDNGRTFRYDKYLQARNIRFLISFGSIYTVEPAPWYSVSAALARVKHSFLDGLNRALPMPDSALAGGIVIGGKAGLGTALQDAFTRSGLVQIIVLSGYNVMIVAEWVMAFLALLALPKRLQFFAGGAALLLFVGIAGISSTAVRAAIMAVIALYARATGRSYAASRALLFAVLLMLIWNPLYLIFDPGFGLSVAATAGIIWLAPIIERRLQRFWKAGFWANAVATTLAAQISVLPLLLYNIGLLSLVALPANLLVNPLVPLAMAWAAVAGVVGMTIGTFIPLIATIAGAPVLILMRYFIFIAEKSSALPYAAFNLPLFSFWLVLAAYATLIYIVASKRFSTTDQFKFAKKASI
ncbi:MAG: ComEC family competence protein [Candidatus Parcubacteria bacterium]|nr:ComEC family competence protein [Candidatus Parcubacteria bacterium]